MSTLIVSDLHLGAPNGGDVLRLEEPRAALLEAISPGGRLVILGDVLELRGTTFVKSFEIAEPVLRAIGDRLGPDGQLMLMVGNHDYGLLSHWLDGRKQDPDPDPLALEQRFAADAAGPLVADLAEAAGCPTEFIYPGVWLRDDVYALHGHYAETHGRLLTEERALAKVMARRHGLPRRGAEPDDYEAVLAPYYSFRQQLAQYPRRRGHDEPEPAREWPPGPVEQGTLRSYTTRALTRALEWDCQQSLQQVLRRLDVDAPYVIWGHSHRSGPWPEDRAREWRTHGGGQIFNTGSWLTPPDAFVEVKGSWPYWPGTAVELDETGPPRLRRLLPTPEPSR